MSSLKDKDYQHSNERGNGPAERMTGGEYTDDIDINSPDVPVKTPKNNEPPAPELKYKKP